MSDRLLYVWKIIADPEAGEEEWLKAYQIVGNAPPPPAVLASNFFITPDYKAQKSRQACLEMALLIGRLGAYILDGFLLAAIFIAICLPFVMLSDPYFGHEWSYYLAKMGGMAVKEQIGLLMSAYLFLIGYLSPLRGLIWHGFESVMLLLPLINWAYHAGFQSSALQATPGELLFGLKVSTRDGRRLSLSQASLRHFSRFINTITLGLTFFVPLINAQQRSIEDLVADTVVTVKEHTAIQNFLEDHMPSAETMQPYPYQQIHPKL